MCLNTWLVVLFVCGGLGGVASLEKVCLEGLALRSLWALSLCFVLGVQM